MKRPAFLLGLLILWQGITAQPFHVDSLRRRVAGAPPDTAKVRLLGTLSTYYNHNHLDSGFYFTQQMIALARQLNDPYGEAWGLSILATSADRTGDMTKSLEVALSCLHLAEKLTYGHDEMIMRAYTQMGVVNFLTGHNRDAINYLHQALYYARRWQPDESAYYQIYAHLGNAHRRAGNLDSSSYYIEKSYNLSGRGGDVYFYPYVRNCEGEINEALGRLDRAKQFYRDAVVEGIRINHLFQLSYAYSQLASLFNRTGELDSSIFYAKKSLQLSREFFYGTFIPAAANLLSQAFEKKNRPDSALKYLRLTMEIKDRVMNQTKQQQFQLLEFEEQQRLARTALANQQYRVRVRTTFLVGGILLLILLLSLLYRNNRLKQKSNRELLGKTKELELAMQHLQETQAQLVHSEKMASLGAMTAGIAHEIQNPLNFVKNFSEVNKELLGELRQDIAAGNLASADQLAQDLESNEEKIIHHGKRADAIVKGMLQHARASGGQKEPTDINALCQELLRAAYHGFRVNDPGFQAACETSLDEAVGVVSVVPQELGRVLLNLINNACYAVKEKAGRQLPGYEPRVAVSTRRLDQEIEIRVSDNGPGIPQADLGKIFQPFFTTKPSGKGVGLGLSLSYAIVKAHDGDMRVSSREGEGTTFTMVLPG